MTSRTYGRLVEVGCAAIAWWTAVRFPASSAAARTRCAAMARNRPLLNSSSRGDCTLIGYFHSSALAICTASVVGSFVEEVWRPNDPPAKGTLTRTRSGARPVIRDAAMLAYSGDSVEDHTSSTPSSRIRQTALCGSIGACARYGTS